MIEITSDNIRKQNVCEGLYNQIIEYGIAYVIETGIYDGVLEDEWEGLDYIQEVIEFFEFTEEYEKCEKLFKMIKNYSSNK